MRHALIAAVTLACAIDATFTLVAQMPRTNEATESFDKPIYKQSIDLGPSQYTSPRDEPAILNCHYYADFMVKELDDPGVKGADPVFRPFRPGQKPPCSRKPQPGERRSRHWDGYFMGVKQNLIFVEAADGLNGALEFQVFDPRAGVRIFHDQRSVADAEGLRKLSFVPTQTSQITLRYRRVFVGPCSIPRHGLACWHKFQQATGLTSAPMPTCRSDDFEGHEQGDDPSVIFYPVETTLLPKPRVKVTGPIDRCSPAE